MNTIKKSVTNDTLLQVVGAQTTAVSAAGTVDGSAVIIDLGVGVQNDNLVLSLDVSAITVDDTDEEYVISLQGSNSATFADTNEILGQLVLGAAAANALRSTDSATGRYSIVCSNYNNATVYRYVRVYISVAGTTPSITISSAYLS